MRRAPVPPPPPAIYPNHHQNHHSYHPPPPSQSQSQSQSQSHSQSQQPPNFKAQIPPAPWLGSEQICIGLDIGTTLSAASITHLIPHAIPKHRLVSKWPETNQPKVPTVGLYDPNGLCVAWGAEAKADTWSDDVADGRLSLVKTFKLHLNERLAPPPYHTLDIDPSGRQSAQYQVPPLPPGVTVQRCYTDAIQYLWKNVRTWWLENTPDGNTLWDRLGPKAVVIIAHPNHWGVREQGVIADAVVAAGVMTVAERDQRLRLVTESEASVHFGLAYAEDQVDGWLMPGTSFCVVDAGGSTVDTCVYTVAALQPRLHLREAKLSDCVQSGGIFVSDAMASIIRRKLGHSPFNTPEYVQSMIDAFDAKVKNIFSNAEDTQIIKFGFDRDTDHSVGISRGKLTLTGAEVEEAFAPAVKRILQSVSDQVEGVPVTHILLVGGFGESPWLQRKLREAFEKYHKVRVVTVDEPSRKAVAAGCVLYYSKDSVVARATRFEFGLSTNRPWRPEYAQLGRKVVSFSSGKSFAPGGWTRIVAKGKVVQSDVPHKESFWVHKRPGDSMTFTTSLFSFAGDDASTAFDGWSTKMDGSLLPGFAQCCTITGDLTELAAATPIRKTPAGEKFRELDFSIGLFFGQTRLTACLIWNQPGVGERRGPASVLPAAFS